MPSAPTDGVFSLERIKKLKKAYEEYPKKPQKENEELFGGMGADCCKAGRKMIIIKNKSGSGGILTNAL